MASVAKKKTKAGIGYFIQLSPGERKTRPKISLGNMTKKQAETARRNIEQLIKCRDSGDVKSPATQEWLDGISDGLRKRLETLDIIEQRDKGRSFTVAGWIDRYFQNRPDVKARTKSNWQTAANKLKAFFKNELICDVTVEQAKSFRVYLKSVAGLNENTLRREIGLARQFFKAAIDAELINKNPFRGQPVAVRANPARFYYVAQETSLKILDACPDAQWRLILGLARWGGLRCPSEVLRLKWQDVDFEHDRFIVHASKTSHHADGGVRTVPMFPELKPLFQDAFDNARDGDVFCITRYRDKSVNLRTRLTKYIRRAGLEPWPKLFQNLRSTRETELFKMTSGNVKAVCSWIGNSPAVAMEHYAQLTEADMKEAAKMSLLQDAENSCQEKRVQKRVQNRVQTTAAPTCTESQESPDKPVVSPDSCNSKRDFATVCDSVQNPAHYPQGESNPCLQDENLIS
jgi:integrase